MPNVFQMRRDLIRVLILWTSLFSVVNAATPDFEDSIAQRVKACVGCHGAQGRATPDGYYPRIAGKPVGYLTQQLTHFRDGRRQHAPMTHLLTGLSDEFLREIAEYFAQLDLPYAAPLRAETDLATLARGKQLVLQGDTSRKLPACIDCHGERLTGLSPNVPGLIGLPRDYLNAQFGSWRNDQRKAHAPDCMASITKRLNENDISAITHWLAAQVVPLGELAKPASGKMKAPGIECGIPPVSAPSTNLSSQVVQSGANSGAYLAKLGNCAGCHSQSGQAPYSGGKAIPSKFGTFYAGNLTPHKSAGIGSWSADDFWKALHQGESKDGRLLYPSFPYTHFTYLTRADSDSLFVFFQQQPISDRVNTAHQLSWPYSSQWALRAWRALYFKPSSFTPNRAHTPELNRGAYLVGALGHCGACHMPRGTLGATASPMHFQALTGSMMPNQDWYAPSLLNLKEGSITNWSNTATADFFKRGQTTDAHAIGPMATVVHQSTQFLNADDLNAMTSLLKSIAPPKSKAPIADQITTNKSGPAKASEAGSALYKKHCADCHGEQGEGRGTSARAAYPGLAQSRAVNLPNAANLIRITLQGGFGPSTMGSPRPFGMPPFSHILNDEEIATLLSTIRASWGNSGSSIRSIEVRQHR
jgi:cytochrome c553